MIKVSSPLGGLPNATEHASAAAREAAVIYA